MSRRIVITGLGPLTPVAAGWPALWAAMSGPGAGGAPERISDALLKAQPLLRHVDRLGRISLAAAALAIEDARLEPGTADPLETGAVIGSGYGCLSTNEEYLDGILQRGPRYGNPVVFQNTVTNAAAGYLSIVHDLQGPTATFCSGWAAGVEALGFACQQIAEDRAERMIAGSADTLSPRLLEGLALQGWLSPRKVPLPFAPERDGTCVCEAACGVLVEALPSARRRGAHVYAELGGWGQSTGAARPGAEALASAIDDALRDADLEPRDLGVVFASANGTRKLDRWESLALAEALGPESSRVPVSCPKAVLGETLGVAGTLAVCVAALALDTGQVPGLPIHVPIEGGCALNLLRESRVQLDPEWALVTALADTGEAQAVVLRRGSP